MFSSFFSTSAPVDPTAPTFHPVTSKYGPNELFGELEPKDIEWLATSSGFVTETQIWYNILEDGTSVMCQIIHSSVGVWYPTIQFTFKIYNPNTKEKIWKSVNVTNFVTPSPGLDRRSCKADQFKVTHLTTGDSETYKINADLGDNFRIALDIIRAPGAPGFKLGRGPEGGYSNFGVDDPAKRDGYAIHRFWPLQTASGKFEFNERTITLENRPGMFVHAIQGMRPNLVASRWNFAHFQGARPGDSAVMMEFTTQPEYGPKGSGSGGVTVNVGGIVVGGRLIAVTGETKEPGAVLADRAEVMSRALHVKPANDVDTGYDAPTGLVFTWAAPSVVKDAPGAVSATLEVDVGGPSAETAKGLIEKVDVLAEIPYVLKTVVNYVAGTKPYIYQWINPAKLVVTGPEALVPGGSTTIEGFSYNEATYI